MAQLDAKTLQNLNKRLKEMDEILASDYRKALDLGKAFTQGFSTEQIDAFLRKLGKINRADAAKLNVMFNLVDVNGKPITVHEAKARVRQLMNAINNEKRNAVSIGGTVISGKGEMTNELKRYKDALSVLGMSTSQQFDLISRNVKKVNNEVKGLRKGFGDMLPTLSRLASAFGVAFSVRGLAQFGKKLIETRGEFEMQFVAMKQIIGDVDAATKIWNQTMQQALQSPFKAMQLVTYTKQLAAYRIETEKLFDTTKRLADISAGLGVDMGRLILAYGQVKSANFLRASEVRQFTEAGVNIVGNLAQYFSELENRAVSTADVMERITKRMVLFSDVEEIFKRMTDEGGTFYNMQEVQADTVKGQIAKLHDAYDQMLNTIGQANQGTLRDFIGTLNDMVKNWRNVALFLKENGIALLAIVPLVKAYRKGVELAATETAYFTTTTTGASQGLQGLSFSERLATKATHTFRGAIFLAKTALKTFVPLMVIEGIFLLINKMTEAGRTAKQLTRTLDEVGSKNSQSLQDNIDGFDKLVKKLEEANEGSQEYLDIRNKIQSQYGEYLDNLSLEQITVENLALAYDKVVERMREKSRQHIFEEGLQEITNVYGDALTKFQKKLADFAFTTGLDVTKDEAVTIAKRMYEMYEKNEKYRGMKNPVSLLNDALKEYYGEEAVGRLNFAQLSIGNDFYKAIELRYEKEIDLATKANALTKANSDTHAEYLEQLRIEAEHEQRIHDIRNDSSVLSKERMNVLLQAEEVRYAEEKLELQAKYQKKGDEWLKNEKDKLKENYGAFLNAYNEQVKAYIGGRFGEGWMKGDNSDAWKAYNFMIANQDRLSQGQTKWEEKILNDKKLTEENIQRIKEQQATQTAADSEAAKALNESLKQEEDRLELIKKQMELLGLHEKQKGGSGSANNSIYGERIRLLQDMLQKYKQLAKEAYGYAKAEGKVSESFEDAWNSIMPAGYGDLEVPTSYKALAEMLQRLEAFTPAFDKNGQLSKMLADLKKAVSDALSQVDIELSVRIREDFGKQMEKAFGDYELTVELGKMNLPKGVAADMWGIEETDLQDLRKRLSQMYMGLRDENGQLSDEAFKDYEKFLNKIDDLERKQQKERLKDYSKYLEAQYSERVKIEMDYVRKLAALEAETAIKEPQKSEIREGLKREFLEKSRKQDWEDFKGSEFYVGMMEDLEKQGSASLEVMRNKLLEMRKNAENLSPRALKEVVNALEKIDELEKKRISPLQRIREEQEKLRGIEIKDVYERIAANQEKLSQDEQEQKDLERMIMLEEERQKLEKQGINLEEAKARLARSEQALSLILPSLETRSDGTKEGEERRRILTETVNQAKKEVETWAEIVRILSGQATIDEQERGSKYKGLSLSDLKKRRDDAKQRIKDLEGAIGKDEELVKAQKDLEDAWNDTWEAAKRWAQSINGIFDGVMDTIGYFSDSTSTLTAEWKEFGDTSISALTDLVSGIQAYQQANAAAQKAGLATGLFTANGLQLAMVVLGVIIKVVQAIAKLHDARIDKEIEQSKERVDDLQKAYERLEKQIEKTFDTVSYMSEFRKETQNLYEQIEEANRQIAAAQDYKSEDKRKEAIEAAEDAKQQALDSLEEIKQAQIEVFGGIGGDSYRSAAEGFVDAWKSAFLETGDGLQGLQDHFDEFLQDWFTKQATMQGVAKYYQKVFDYINGVVEDGSVPTRQEIENARLLADEAALKSDELMQAYASIFGLGGEGSLSGLAAGIQGMTEEQANILEAYWNSVRTYTASIDMNVARIAETLGAGGVNTNPQLQQLNLIAENTAATQTLLQSVTKSGHGLGGAGIKVFVE